jgi:uncharacterized protein (UPF0333 family)
MSKDMLSLHLDSVYERNEIAVPKRVKGSSDEARKKNKQNGTVAKVVKSKSQKSNYLEVARSEARKSDQKLNNLIAVMSKTAKTKSIGKNDFKRIVDIHKNRSKKRKSK